MAIRALTILGLVLAVSGLVAQSQETLRFAVGSAQAIAGDLILFSVLLKHDAKNVRYDGVGSLFDFPLRVVGPDGNEPARRGRADIGLGTLLNDALIEIEAGREWRAEVDLAKVYVLDQPGPYVVQRMPGLLSGKTKALPLEKNVASFTIAP